MFLNCSSTNIQFLKFSFQEHLERFTHIVVDSVLTKIQSNDPVHVIFIATRSGTIKKLSYNPRSQQTCVVEILHPFAEGRSVNIHRWEFNGLYDSFLFPISSNYDVCTYYSKLRRVLVARKNRFMFFVIWKSMCAPCSYIFQWNRFREKFPWNWFHGKK